MRVQVTAGVGAWIVGATAATGLSLFAVSFLGTDASVAQGRTMSQGDVARQLAGISATPSDPASGRASDPPSATPSADPTTPATAPSTPGPSAPPSGTSSPSTASARPAAPTTSAAQPVVRRLSTAGGDIVARCQSSGLVYLVSWSPAQDFQVGLVQRGPARYTTVVFQEPGHWIDAHVTCSGGTPVLVSGDDHSYDH